MATKMYGKEENKMYSLKVLIITDDDFGYDDDVLHVEPDVERTFIFKTREEAVDALLKHTKCVVNTLRVYDRGYIKTWYQNWNLALQTLIKKLDTFAFGKIFGNQEVHYALGKYEIRQLDNGISYIDESLDYDLELNSLNLEDLDWEKIQEMKDII